MKIYNILAQSAILMVLCSPIVCMSTIRFGIFDMNVLNEHYYSMNYNKAIPNKHGIMPLAQRQQLLDNMLAPFVKNNNPIIITLQENDNNFLPIVRQYTAQQFLQPSAPGITTALYGQWPVTVARRDSYTQFKSAPLREKGYLPIIVTPVDSTGTAHPAHKITIINTHFVGGAGPNNNYDQHRYNQAQEIANYIRDNRAQSAYWIIAGDFNTDSRSNPAIYAGIVKIFNGSGITFLDANKEPLNQRISAYANGALQNIDYIFYSNNLRLAESGEIESASDAQARQDLLSHGYGTGDPRTPQALLDQNRTAPSDHTYLLAFFEIPIAAPIRSRVAGSRPQQPTPPVVQPSRPTPQQPVIVQPQPINVPRITPTPVVVPPVIPTPQPPIAIVRPQQPTPPVVQPSRPAPQQPIIVQPQPINVPRITPTPVVVPPVIPTPQPPIAIVRPQQPTPPVVQPSRPTPQAPVAHVRAQHPVPARVIAQPRPVQPAKPTPLAGQKIIPAQKKQSPVPAKAPVKALPKPPVVVAKPQPKLVVKQTVKPLIVKAPQKATVVAKKTAVTPVGKPQAPRRPAPLPQKAFIKKATPQPVIAPKKGTPVKPAQPSKKIVPRKGIVVATPAQKKAAQDKARKAAELKAQQLKAAQAQARKKR